VCRRRYFSVTPDPILDSSPMGRLLFPFGSLRSLGRTDRVSSFHNKRRPGLTPLPAKPRLFTPYSALFSTATTRTPLFQTHANSPPRYTLLLAIMPLPALDPKSIGDFSHRESCKDTCDVGLPPSLPRASCSLFQTIGSCSICKSPFDFPRLSPLAARGLPYSMSPLPGDEDACYGPLINSTLVTSFFSDLLKKDAPPFSATIDKAHFNLFTTYALYDESLPEKLQTMRVDLSAPDFLRRLSPSFLTCFPKQTMYALLAFFYVRLRDACTLTLGPSLLCGVLSLVFFYLPSGLS